MPHTKNVLFTKGRSDNAVSIENVRSASTLHLPDNSKSQKKCYNNYHSYQGLFYTVLASVSLTLTSVFVKQLTYISPGQLSAVRSIGLCVGSLPIAIYRFKEILGPKCDRPILFIRGFVGATALNLHVIAFRYLPLAEAAIILSTMPAVTTVMARLYLKESCGLVQSFALVITLCGLLLSVRLPDILKNRNNFVLDKNYMIGIASAVGCVLTLSLALVLQRKMRSVHFSITLFYLGFIGTVENGAINFFASYFTWPICGWDEFSVLLISIFSFIAHSAIFLAIEVENVGIVTVIKASMDIIAAFVFQVIFFNLNPDIYNISGACLVILSISLIGMKKWLNTLPEESKTKNRFKFFFV